MSNRNLMLDIVRPKHLDETAALLTAQSTPMRKLKGERDTEFVKRIVAAYLNAVGALYSFEETRHGVQ